MSEKPSLYPGVTTTTTTTSSNKSSTLSQYGFLNMGKGTRLFLVFSILTFSLSFFPEYSLYLSLNPSVVRKVQKLWTLFSSCWMEPFQLHIPFNLFAIVYSGKIIEPLWGAKEYIRFLILVNALSGTSVFFFLLFSSFFENEENLFMDFEYYNFSCFLGAFGVCLKQLWPETEVNFLYLYPIRYKQFVMVYFMGLIALVAFGYPYFPIIWAFFGTFWSYIYLRYFQSRSHLSSPSNSLSSGLGDRSDAFAPLTFLPDTLQSFFSPYLQPKPKQTKPTQQTLLEAFEPSEDMNAQRRRQRAQRLIDQSLTPATTTTTTTTTTVTSQKKANELTNNSSHDSLSVSSTPPQTPLAQSQDEEQEPDV